jgi:hypothetical protein
MIIIYHENDHSKRSIANKYGIEPKKLSNAAPYTRRLNTGASPKYPHLENELLEWVKEARNQLKTVTRYMIQAK